MLVLDADPVSAQRSAATIARVGRFDVIATLASAAQARDLLRRAPCQLLIVDPQLAGGGGPQLIRWVRGRQLETVRRELVRFPTATAAELARPTGMSRVTVLRYLEDLVASDQARVTTRPGARGRPAKHYDPG